MKETADTLRWLQGIIDHSGVTAGAAVKRNFIGGGWAMTAEEFVSFWGEGRMAAMSTVSARGKVHVAPLEPKLVDGKFYIPTFPDSQRLKDLRANPRCAISSWDSPYRAVIVYGNASEAASDPTGRTSKTASEQGYEAGAMVTVEVTPTRIYAIRPPRGHPAAAPQASS